MKIKSFISYTLLFATMLSIGCKKSDIATFTGVSAINFGQIERVNSVTYSFMTNPDDNYIQEIPVIIMGDTTSTDRTFNVEVVQDSGTTAKPGQYEILEGVVKRGEVQGTLFIKLIKTEDLDTSTVSLKLKIGASQDFKPGNIETQEFTVKWTNQVVVPAWTYFRYFFTSVASTTAYRLIVQTTGLTTLTAQEYGALGEAAVTAYATKFGDYIKQWNKDHPTDKLKHDDGTQKGQEIVPLYYTHSKFD